MIKDISIIRKELEGFEEVVLPYSFTTGSTIKYITIKNKKNEGPDSVGEESFYKGGEFINMGNDCLILKKKHRTWTVPLYKRNKDGTINYSTRFFMKEEIKCDENIRELNEIVANQQHIIEIMTLKITELEITKQQLHESKQSYEELLQQNRFNLKELSIRTREKDEKISKYEDIIKKLVNSQQLFTDPNIPHP